MTRTRKATGSRGSAGDRAPAESHRRIRAVVLRIPRGRVATYGQVAELSGFPGQARLVGYALHALPEGSRLPWHRVLGAGGVVSLLRSGAPAGITQRLRLEREGVRVDARHRVDLTRYGWRPGRERPPRSERGRGSPWVAT